MSDLKESTIRALLKSEERQAQAMAADLIREAEITDESQKKTALDLCRTISREFYSAMEDFAKDWFDTKAEAIIDKFLKEHGID